VGSRNPDFATLASEALEADLLPCPFCGGKGAPDALMIGPIGKVASAHGHFIECQDCLSMTGSAETQAEAVERWNRRAK
jgi:Lar family restriction alleviation protein